MHPRLASRLGAAFLFALAAACGDPPPEGIRIDESVRLTDLLDRARIDTPLTEITGARGLEDLGEVPQHPVFEENFEAFDAAAIGWPVTERGKVAPSDQGSAFVLRRHQRDDRRGWVLPAEPNTHYVFERRIKTPRHPDADFVVVEAFSAEMLEKELDPEQGWENQSGLRLHRVPEPAADGRWQRGSTSFTTTPQTFAVGVMLRTTPERRSDLNQWGRRSENETWFDDLRLVRVEPTPQQTVALLKARACAEGSDLELGMEKHGQFPPTAGHGQEHRPEDDNYSFRYALYAPPRTEITFPLTLTAPAVLHFSICLSRETPPGDAARFQVVARVDGEEQVLWSNTLRAHKRQWWWHQHQVELDPLAGKTVEISLVTEAAKGHPHPLWGNPALAVEDATAPRNVILIAVDTLRADRLSSYGYGLQTSPNLDALAADGVRFHHVSSNATWTCPSFASIFTGLTPSRHGIWNHGHMTPLGLHFETLADLFRAEGWTTNSIAYKAPIYGGGFEQGFDVAFNVPRVNVRAQDNLAEALQWLGYHAHRRNFLFLHFDDPHQPFTQPEPFDSHFGTDLEAHGVRLPISIHNAPPDDPEQRDLVRKLYDGEIAYVDDRIGAFLGELKKRGLYDDAVIAFVSDHGEELWEHGQFGHGSGKLFDEAIRVPLIVKPGAGEFARGRVVEAQVRGFDVMPTLLELAGIELPEALDAESLVPMLRPDAGDPPDRVAVTETSTKGAALRTRQWKYILDYWQVAESVERLFDHQADPGETANVAADHPAVVAELRHGLLEFFLLHRPGTYLVAVDEPGADYALQIEGASSAVTFFGPRPEQLDGETLAYRGTAAERLAVMAQVNSSGHVSVNGELLEPERYTEGQLALLLQGAPSLHLFEGPPPLTAGEAPVDTQTMDLEQLEALRALGYLDGGQNDEEDGR